MSNIDKTPKPLIPVSVVIPVFNGAQILTRALDSIAAQTALPIQIIIVDDASRDDTKSVLEEYCVSQAHLSIERIHLRENVGAATARNIGWRRATEPFIAFLDADDSWHPKKLEIQYAWMKTHPDVFLCGHACEVVESEIFREVMPFDAPPVRWFFTNSFLFRNRLSTPTVMLQKSISERFLDGKRHCEDYLLWTQIASAHGPVAFIELPLTRLHKKKYGASGLSADLWAMQKGELDAIYRLQKELNLKFKCYVWWAILAVSWLKFFKRYFVTLLLKGG